MKKLFLLLAVTFAASSVFGQDRIITLGSEEIEAKIVEVTSSIIKYRRFSNPDGPIFNIARRDVMAIKYENGETEGFTGEELGIRRNSTYTIGSTRMSHSQVLTYLAQYEDVVKNIKAGNRMKKAAIATGCVGGGIAAIGLLTVMTAATMSGDDLDYGIVDAGLGIIGAGILIGLPSIGLGIGSVKAQKKAMRLYNERAGYASLSQPDMSLMLGFTSGGLGLQLNF